MLKAILVAIIYLLTNSKNEEITQFLKIGVLYLLVNSGDFARQTFLDSLNSRTSSIQAGRRTGTLQERAT